MSFLLKPLAVLSASALSLLGLMSTKSQKARYYFHLTLYIGALGFCSFLGVLYGIFGTILGQRLNINYLTARSFYYICSPLVGIRLEVDGEEHLTSLLTARNGAPQSAVLIGNHQSFLDILYLGRIFPKRASIMAKRELKWTPLLGQFMSLSGAVFVDRKNNKDAVKLMNQAGDDMKRKGISLWVFPEGTRSSQPEPHLLPFKKGAFHLAVQASVPIVPVVCESYHRLFNGKDRMERGCLRVKVLPPISTEGMTSSDVAKLAETVRADMLKALLEISSPDSQAPRPNLRREESNDSTVPLTSAMDGRDSLDHNYGARGSTDSLRHDSKQVTTRDTSKHSELRRRVSQGDDDSEAISTHEQVSRSGGAPTQGHAVRETRDGTEDELDDDGAVLVKRP